MLTAIVAILCGLILAARLLPALRGASSTLAPIGGILGVIAIILGVLGLLGGFSWLALVLLLVIPALIMLVLEKIKLTNEEEKDNE